MSPYLGILNFKAMPVTADGKLKGKRKRKETERHRALRMSMEERRKRPSQDATRKLLE